MGGWRCEGASPGLMPAEVDVRSKPVRARIGGRPFAITIPFVAARFVNIFK